MALVAKNGSGGPNCGLGTHLAPFGLIGLGQKGPKWPTDCESRPTGHRSHRGPKWPKKAIYAKTPIMKGVALNPRMRARGLKAPRRQNDPQAQNQR
ncbi:hypothetical protein O181_021728 [Austropuccinia psidii MF-1]|uniref:Uncharacterized protein n=1 Tax=Austropuccinia psidii MF-1 TaxID=1389203 RepID=A0A9Q3CDW4_9BASI|nr:hypothetical protein [Austropuccinia psidii MF-1]